MADKHNITKEYLNSLFTYNNGYLYWKQSRKGTKANSFVGSKNDRGYLVTQLNGKKYKNHLLIYMMFNDATENEIDHIDGNQSNNRIENLREATKSNNQWNKGKQSNNTSGYKNVIWSEKVSKWYVQIKKNGKRYWGGYFDNIQEANIMATNMRNELHKSFSRN